MRAGDGVVESHVNSCGPREIGEARPAGMACGCDSLNDNASHILTDTPAITPTLTLSVGLIRSTSR
jgi:hypothetical protein